MQATNQNVFEFRIRQFVVHQLVNIVLAGQPSPAERKEVMNKKRILIVDDDPGITRSIKLNLEATGCYEVQTENFAVKALASACRFKPDLIILDVMMPAQNGGEVAAQIRGSSSLKDIPIVFLTAIVSNQETGGRESTFGAMSYLAKPVEWLELKKCIEEHLGK